MKHLGVLSALGHLLRRLRAFYWFLPGLVIGGSVGLSYVMLSIDEALPFSYISQLGWVYTRDPAGARAMLSVVSQSMITVAGVVFSVTVVSLTLASNQFGTRVLKSFARDTGNQLALGTLLGTFLYGVLVMRRVESETSQFVPSISVAVGVLLAIVSVAVLVYFIHHVIAELQGENVVAAVARDLYGTMDDLFPQEYREETASPPSVSEQAMLACDGVDVFSDREGFIRTLNQEKVLELAEKNGVVVRLLVLPGDFVTRNTVLAQICDGNASERVRTKLPHAIDIGAQRSYDDDIGFGLQQLSLVAARSLSPAVNAVGTALDAMERLIASLVRLGGKKLPCGYLRDRRGRLRVVAQPIDLEDLIAGLLDPVRDAVTRNPTVVAHIVSRLGRALSDVRNPEMRRVLSEHLDRFAALAADFPLQFDRDRVRRLHQRYRDWRAA